MDRWMEIERDGEMDGWMEVERERERCRLSHIHAHIYTVLKLSHKARQNPFGGVELRNLGGELGILLRPNSLQKRSCFQQGVDLVDESPLGLPAERAQEELSAHGHP